MKLTHSFTVPVPPDEAWTTLLDIESTASCLPGASIESISGDDVDGSVSVKVGPIGFTYRGRATFVERDAAQRRITLDARSRDVRGGSTANATVTATLHPAGADATKVQVDTDLDITGKPAQFGSGVITEVGNRIIGQFAERLAEKISERGAGGEAPGEPRSAEQPRPAADTGTGTGDQGRGRPAEDTQADAMSAFALIGPVLARRAAPALLGIGAGILVGWLARGSGGRGHRGRCCCCAPCCSAR